jgi:hypothetical protein
VGGRTLDISLEFSALVNVRMKIRTIDGECSKFSSND